MMLALVNDERQRRQELRMIIQPLSDDFINGSPESLPVDSFRLQACLSDSTYIRPVIVEREGWGG
jgi:hypothetical protein